MIVFLVRTFSSDLKGWAIRKVMEGGGCRNIFFRMKDIFSGLLAVHAFFSQFSLAWFFFGTSHPPITFLMVHLQTIMHYYTLKSIVFFPSTLMVFIVSKNQISG